MPDDKIAGNDCRQTALADTILNLHSTRGGT
jgi:hypothetical protein